MKDFEAAKKAYDEVMRKLLEQLPLEERLKGISPEERLEGLTPEQLAALVTSDEFLERLPPEAREQLAKKLPH